MPMMEAPTQREQEKLRCPSSTYLDLQTDCSSNIYFLFIWLTACCIFTFPNDFMQVIEVCMPDHMMLCAKEGFISGRVRLYCLV